MMKSARPMSPVKFIQLLRNMAVSLPRPANKRRAWKAPDKGNSRDETPKDTLFRQPPDDSILHIDGSVLEGVCHVTL